MTVHVRPVVTVAIPVFNSATTLERAVRSAMAQTLGDIEILIADDGSTDASAEIAEALAREDSRIRVIRLPTNGGKPHAMNVMVEAARGRWIAVLDADDSFHETRLARLVDAAEMHGVEMAADNLLYFDAGVGKILRSAFPPFATPRLLTTRDLLANNDSFADFDYGLLKPIVRTDFVRQHELRYYEQTRLAEDFYYLLSFFVAGGRGCLIGDALYCWTLPFGTQSRKWTTTGAGPWRYNYRDALAANQHFIAEMAQRSQHHVVAMLQVRSRQYQVMIHYLDAQRHASERRWLAALATIACHPSTYRLLLGRIAGRALRAVTPRRRSAARAGSDTILPPSATETLAR